MEKALEQLLLCPLLHFPQASHVADTLIINIIGSKDLVLKDVNHIGYFLAEHFNSTDNTVIGAIIDEDKEDYLEICVIGLMSSLREGTTKTAKCREENPRQQVFFDDMTMKLSSNPRKNASDNNADRGYFYETERNMFNGEDVDIPTYLRRGIRIKL